mmetsp:Transcript_5664/g.14183  ORF Transcript_5664/g.14183 Transcript_5664/m.14183 type:complete len:442 (-) Transcript_5664:432-1757(-)
MVNYPPFVHAIGGAVGGALSTFAVYPLELIRVEIQSRADKKHLADDDEGGGTTRTDEGENGNKNDIYQGDTDGDDDRERIIKNQKPAPETNVEVFLRLYKEKSLYRGSSNMVTTLMISNFILFYTLQVIRGRVLSNRYTPKQRDGDKTISILRYLFKLILPESELGTSLFASSLAGVINVLLTTPLWVATRRIMEGSQPREDYDERQQREGNNDKNKRQRRPNNNNNNLWCVMHSISRKEGILELWHGTWSSLLLVSNPAIQYFLYETIRVWLLERRNNKRQLAHQQQQQRHRGRVASGRPETSLSASLTPIEAFVFGAIAKTISTVITYPLQLGQVLIRLRNSEISNASSSSSVVPAEKNNDDFEHETRQQNMKAYNGMIDCLYQQFTRGGIYSLFQGMDSKLLQTVLQAAFTFLTYEQTLGLIGRMYQSSLIPRSNTAR